MGNDEAIIYGDRHGERYRELSDDSAGKPERTYYPNAVALNCLGGQLQVGVVTFDQGTGERNRYYGDNENDTWDSLWTSLDRRGINRLIRDLRRMRDRVYGKDE